MNRLTIGLALLALGGCSICQKHETACFVGATILAGSIVASQHGHNSNSGVDGRDYTIIPVDCTNPQVCK